jgi:DNA helicase-2/ATP-dependent DNA helicase PcrA
MIDLESPILQNLNPDQLRAVTHEHGPLLILAGAGSGKTRVITRRIAWLVRERAVMPSRILAVTFTNKAAGEMRERVEQLLEGRDSPRWMGTFHSICLRMLRIHSDLLGFPRDFAVYDDDDQESVLRRILKEVGEDPKTIRRFSSFIDAWKNEGVLEPPAGRTRREEVDVEVFRRYQAALKASAAMDFGDLLCMTLRLLDSNPDVRSYYQDQFSHLLVDEFQDTNLVQYEVLKRLVGPHRNLCVVGDDDQSIYSWRGARIENILGFPKDFPDAAVVTLRQNYRSSSQILGASSRVIGFNKGRHGKELEAVRGEGRLVNVHSAFGEQDEATFVVRRASSFQAEGIPLSHMAVFYRTNAQARAFEDALRARRMPYRVIGGQKFYSRREIKDVIAYLRLLVNPCDSAALERIYNVPSRGIGGTTIEKAREKARLSGEPLLMALAKVGDESGPALKAKILAFVTLLMDLAVLVADSDAEDVVRLTLERTGYLAMLQADDSQEGKGRLENVEELVGSVRDLAVDVSGKRDLRTYLDRVSLLQPAEQPEGSEETEAINLMTVHAAKGLEFDVAFVCGLEEELFPHQNSLGSQSAIEEERRLMYVAMTRARDHLFLTHASTRSRFREIRPMRMSRFLSELPRAMVQVVSR